MPDIRLFISHASSDTPLVQAFVDLLEGGVGVPPRQIFCSSLKGQGIAPGAEFKESIRGNLDEASCVIALISPNFYGSPFCMCELGGVWLQSKDFIPVLVPPNDYADMKAVLEGLQALKLEVSADLDELRDEVGSRLGIEVLDTPRWNQRKESFLERLPALLEVLPEDTPVERQAYVKLQDQLEEYKTEYRKLEELLAEQKVTISRLEVAKDPKEVQVILYGESPASGEFEDLAAAAEKAMRALPSCVREALYYRGRGEDLYPRGSDEWEDVQRPLEYGQLQLNSDENGVTPDFGDTKVREAAQAVDELEEWISEAPVEFFEWYESEYDGDRPDLQLRQFWEDNLGL